MEKGKGKRILVVGCMTIISLVFSQPGGEFVLQACSTPSFLLLADNEIYFSFKLSKRLT